MDLFLAGRAAGKTSLCIDRLLSSPTAVLLVHDAQRQDQARGRVRAVAGVGDTVLEAACDRVFTLAEWRRGVHLGRTADPLMVDDADDILMSLLGCYVALATVTQR